MGYAVALSKAWQELEDHSGNKHIRVRFLADEYTVDLENKRILSSSCNVAAKDWITILILHYLKQKMQGLPLLSSQWLSFRELAGGKEYFPVFKKRVIDVIARKYGCKPDALLGLTERFKAKASQLADVSVVVEVFDGVEVLIALWRGDDEFGPEANILFDESIKNIFCTEDIVVLAEFIAHSV